MEKKEIDIKRITTPIKLPLPIFSPSPCNVNVSRMDTNQWIKDIPEVDLVYYDPPYNKHPYSIYFFMLDIINDWNLDLDPDDLSWASESKQNCGNPS